MKDKDYDYIARLELAIKEKYGDEAIQNPAKFWNEQKEKDYLEQVRENVDKEKTEEVTSEFENVDGILISRKLINKETILNCFICKDRLKTIEDDIYITKYECCEKCYIYHIEGREDRWKQGWRPENVTKST